MSEIAYCTYFAHALSMAHQAISEHAQEHAPVQPGGS